MCLERHIRVYKIICKHACTLKHSGSRYFGSHEFAEEIHLHSIKITVQTFRSAYLARYSIELLPCICPPHQHSRVHARDTFVVVVALHQRQSSPLQTKR